MRWARHVACIGELRNAYIIFVGNHKGNRPLRRPRLGWKDNFKMDHKEMGWVWVRVNTIMNHWVP